MTSAYESCMEEMNEMQKEITRLKAELHSVRVSNKDLQEKVSRQASLLFDERTQTATECMAIANDFPLYGYAGQEVADAIKEKFGLEI